MFKRVYQASFGFFLGLLGLAAHAQTAIDVGGATEGITAAQGAIIAIISAFIGLSVAVLGYNKVSAFLKRKSGA